MSFLSVPTCVADGDCCAGKTGKNGFVLFFLGVIG